MKDAGGAFMGIGRARGENRSVIAAEAAIASPLLEASIEGARGVLLSIAGASDLGLFEVNEAARLVQKIVHPDANIIWGTVIDEKLGDEVIVTVVAAGFDSGQPAYKPAPTLQTNAENEISADVETSEELPSWLASESNTESEEVVEATPAKPIQTIVFDDGEIDDEVDVPDFLK
jgi:cell division protein FtsZ